MAKKCQNALRNKIKASGLLAFGYCSKYTKGPCFCYFQAYKSFNLSFWDYRIKWSCNPCFLLCLFMSVEASIVEDGHTCVRAAQAPRWFKCIRPDHPAQEDVMLCTVQCRPAAACARKSPPRVHSKETRQDKKEMESFRCHLSGW